MKRVFRIAVALGLLVSLTVPAVALAAPGQSASPFKATYGDETVYTCTGVRIVKGDILRDEEVCLLSGDTSWVVPGRYTGDPAGDVAPFVFFWGSDYDGALATRGRSVPRATPTGRSPGTSSPTTRRLLPDEVGRGDSERAARLVRRRQPTGCETPELRGFRICGPSSQHR